MPVRSISYTHSCAVGPAAFTPPNVAAVGVGNWLGATIPGDVCECWLGLSERSRGGIVGREELVRDGWSIYRNNRQRQVAHQLVPSKNTMDV